ncbi:MAG TPA: prolyl oligopeptidase family serine peptidase [Phycisphaerales bacterium]|nr:prolyl oligopeptidase family serine peptidase [Phycisphaerales bacterium]
MPASRFAMFLPAAALLACGSILLAGSSGAPSTRKAPVTNEYHGVKVTDDYQWLENWSDPEVKAWSDAQNQHTRAVLDAIPHADDIRARLTELETGMSEDYRSLKWSGGRLFALKNQPPKQQPMLVWMSSPDDPKGEKIIVDPNQLDAAGTTAIDWFVPSLDGMLVAVSISKGGSESGDVHVYDAGSGKERGDVIPHVNNGTAGGSLAWNTDSSGFFYTRYPRGNERPAEDMEFFQQVYFHKLGDDTSKDLYEIGKEFPRIAEIELDSSHDGRWTLATVANGDGGEHMHWLRQPGGGWRQISKYEDKIVDAKFGSLDQIFLLSRKDSPTGEIWRMKLTNINWEKAALILPRGQGVFDSIHPTKDHLVVVTQEGGPNGVRIVDYTGSNAVEIKLPQISSVGGIAVNDNEELLIRTTSLLEPPAWYRCTVEQPGLVRSGLYTTSPAAFNDCQVIRFNAISKDGTEIPMTVLRKRGTKNTGDNPTILYGYGGYGVNTVPTFQARHKLWVEQGGIYAIAHIRGGGEMGEAWHLNGNLTKKQNVFDDFQACAKTLIEKKFTNPERLAIWGGSNGGLLMGASMTQEPSLFAAVVSFVGIYDMLRVELAPNGAFNVTEFGTVKDKDQFDALYAYSPYHHVKDGVKYPPLLMLTGANDPRVDPMHSRKMAARLQAANPEGCTLLRTSANAGHGVGSSLSTRIEQNVDAYAFLFHQLGVEYKPVQKQPAAPKQP